MYLFYQENTFLHPRQVYNILTQDEEFPIIGTNVCSFMKNIHKKIKCNPENEDYEYDFILDKASIKVLFPTAKPILHPAIA